MDNNFIDSCINKSCVVMSVKNDILFKGHIKNVDDDLLITADIFTKPITKGSIVKIFTVNNVGKDIVFKGYVIFSDNSCIKLQKIEIINGYDNRQFYRINVKDAAEIVLDIADDMVETSDIDDFIFEVELEDLSIGGCSFLSHRDFKISQTFTMKLVLNDKCLMLSSVIRRIIEENENGKLYGVQFLMLTDAEETIIEAFVSKVHRQNVVNFRNMLK